MISDFSFGFRARYEKIKKIPLHGPAEFSLETADPGRFSKSFYPVGCSTSCGKFSDGLVIITIMVGNGNGLINNTNESRSVCTRRRLLIYEKPFECKKNTGRSGQRADCERIFYNTTTER